MGSSTHACHLHQFVKFCVWFDAFDGGICVCGMITTMFSTAENIVLQLHKKIKRAGRGTG
jgi:hypothetical protein